MPASSFAISGIFMIIALIGIPVAIFYAIRSLIKYYFKCKRGDF